MKKISLLYIPFLFFIYVHLGMASQENIKMQTTVHKFEHNLTKQGRFFFNTDVGLSFANGANFDKEYEFQLSFSYKDNSIQTTVPVNTIWNYHLNVEYFFINNFGLVLGYNGKNITQTLMPDNDNYSLTNQDLQNQKYLTFSAVSGGLNWHFYTTKSTTFFFSGKYNYLLKGMIYPFALANSYYNTPQPEVKMTGWYYSLGLGFYHFSNHIYLGFEGFYNRTYFKTEKKIYSDLENHFSSNFFDFCISIGFYL